MKKISTMIWLNRIVLLALLSVIAGCDSSSDNNAQNNSNHEFTVSGVNDYDFLFNETEAGGAITFSSKLIKSCRLSFIKSNFFSGYSARVTELGKGEIDLICMTEKNVFTLNRSGKTSIEMSVSDVGGKTEVNLSFLLFSMKSKSELKKLNIKLVLNQKQKLLLSK